jgi:hypothetical protein
VAARGADCQSKLAVYPALAVTPVEIRQFIDGYIIGNVGALGIKSGSSQVPDIHQDGIPFQGIITVISVDSAFRFVNPRIIGCLEFDFQGSGQIPSHIIKPVP